MCAAADLYDDPVGSGLVVGEAPVDGVERRMPGGSPMNLAFGLVRMKVPTAYGFDLNSETPRGRRVWTGAVALHTVSIATTTPPGNAHVLAPFRPENPEVFRSFELSIRPAIIRDSKTARDREGPRASASNRGRLQTGNRNDRRRGDPLGIRGITHLRSLDCRCGRGARPDCAARLGDCRTSWSAPGGLCQHWYDVNWKPAARAIPSRKPPEGADTDARYA
jgi:hypothetical protein